MNSDKHAKIEPQEMTMSHVYGMHASTDLGTKAAAVLKAPFLWMERRRQRRELQGVLGLPDYLIKDIGLQRHQITQETVKPFWRP
jgi:uncharacterized protein YjiS (DUF1127 family)